MKAIIGLGNPARKYRLTRHNVGFLAVDRIAKTLPLKAAEKKFGSLVYEAEIRGERVILVKPLTFMNLSGEAVGAIASKKRLHPANMLVICDDASLPLGRIRLRKSGGSGGHKGLLSIINVLNTKDFARLRIGISEGGSKINDLSEYVLGKFSRRELALVDKALGAAAEAAHTYLSEGIEKAMSRFNNRDVS